MSNIVFLILKFKKYMYTSIEDNIVKLINIITLYNKTIINILSILNYLGKLNNCYIDFFAQICIVYEKCSNLINAKIHLNCAKDYAIFILSLTLT